MFSYDRQKVSNTAHFVRSSLITSFLITNRKQWVALHILWKTVSSPLFPWSTGSEWHYTFCERQSHHFTYDQQVVSDIALPVKDSLMTLITLFFMTIRKLVRLNISWKTVSSHLLLWHTGCEWHCTFLWKAVSSFLLLSPTESEWHCTFCERQSHECHHIVFCEWQKVSDIAHLVKGSVIISFSMTNRKWMTFHIRQMAVLSHLFLDQQLVSKLYTLWKTVWSHLSLWPKECGWHKLHICNRQSYPIFSYDQQQVSDLHILWKAVSLYLFLSPTACEWNCTFSTESQSHDIFCLTNSLWVMLNLSCILSIWPQSMNVWCIVYQKVSILPPLFQVLCTIIIIDCKISVLLTNLTCVHFSHLYNFPWFPGEWCWFIRYWFSYEFAC